MRLTLRTMLAYMDGILDPKDAEDIGKKIEESEFATGLLHRIRDVVRRMRLAAPGLGDQTAGLDANSVAEYLDNTLPSDIVTDFEKVCLESDVHLSEVASCHQILTLVLGEPAGIDAASRQRMYELKDAAEAADVPSDRPPVLPAREKMLPLTSSVTTLDLSDEDGEPGRRKHRAKPTVPEYLREPRRHRRWLPVAVGLLLTVCFTVVVLKALGQFEPEAPLGNMLVRWGIVASPPVTEVASAPQSRPAKLEEPNGTPDSAPVQPSEPCAAEAAKALNEETAVAPQPTSVATKEPADVKEPATLPDKEAVSMPSAAAPKVPAIEFPSETTKEEEKGPAAAIAAKREQPRNLPPPPEPGSITASHGGTPPSDVAADAHPKPEAAAAMAITPDKGPPQKEAGAAPNALPPEPIGRLVSADQILLRDDGTGGWMRVATGETFAPGRIMALPTYRPKVTLSVGVTMEILGGTLVELLPGDSQGPPGIRIVYGRVGLLPLSQPGTHLKVAFGSRSGVITFGDADSVAAFDVRRLHPPGTNPEDEPPHIVANLYCAAGSITWDEVGGGPETKPLRLEAPQWVSFNAVLTSEPATSKELPPWLVAEPISPLDRLASPAIAKPQAMPTDRLARLSLMELNARPQKEVRWLALRCLAYIDQFGDMVKALNDPARKLDWPDYVDELRDAVARDAQSAAAVRLALEKHYPEQAAALYRMLWGYSNRELEGGEDAHLVRDMNDDLLAMRRLSFWNLRDLTGAGVYQPEQTAAKRQPTLRRWQQRLDAHEIRLKTRTERVDGAAEIEAPDAPLPAR